MAGTAQQQALLAQAQTEYTAAVTAYNSAISALNDARAAAQNCQNARDQYSLGWKKNNACHIDTLSSLNNAWRQAEQLVATRREAMNQAAAKVENIQKQIDAGIAQDVATLQTDPKFNLQSQQIAANAAATTHAAAIKAANEKALAEAKQKRNFVIAIVALVLATIITIAILLMSHKANK